MSGTSKEFHFDLPKHKLNGLKIERVIKLLEVQSRFHSEQLAASTRYKKKTTSVVGRSFGLQTHRARRDSETETSCSCACDAASIRGHIGRGKERCGGVRIQTLFDPVVPSTRFELSAEDQARKRHRVRSKRRLSETEAREKGARSPSSRLPPLQQTRCTSDEQQQPFFAAASRSFVSLRSPARRLPLTGNSKQVRRPAP